MVLTKESNGVEKKRKLRKKKSVGIFDQERKRQRRRWRTRGDRLGVGDTMKADRIGKSGEDARHSQEWAKVEKERGILLQRGGQGL